VDGTHDFVYANEMSLLRSILRRPQLAALGAAWIAALASASALRAGTLSDPAVDSYNVRVGTQTFGPLYQFTTNTVLVETADAMTNMGSDTIKFYIGWNASVIELSGNPLPSNETNLITLARNDPSYQKVLGMPFRHFIIWTYPFDGAASVDQWWYNGYNTNLGGLDYREMYDLTCYLLTNYNNTGKTFYLGHWEGDGYLDVFINESHWATNPPALRIQGMIGWLNNRQKAVDDAKNNTPHTNVDVFNYTEVNRVRDAMFNGSTNNVRSINYVVPYVTNLDYLSWSSYEAQNLGSTDLYATLDYMVSHVPTNKAGRTPGGRWWVGEYGYGYESPAAQEPLTRSYIQRLIGWSWGGECLQYILFWEMYNNSPQATGQSNFCLIDPNDNKTPCYYLHQYFINGAKLFTAQFKETNGSLPTAPQFSSLVSPMLNAPLAPANLTLTNVTASLRNGATALVSATLAQGVYGDDEAVVSFFWGRQNGGTNAGAWEGGGALGVNTNFNPVVFRVALTNLAAAANYYFAFYASNASAQVWAPGRLSAAGLATTNYACRMKISFSGYGGSQTLANFPALVQLGEGLPGFSYAKFASPTGGDLRFTDAGGLTLLPHEIDQWNTSGVSSVWVGVPALSGTNTSIWAYWGNPAETDVALPPSNVWLNAGYEIVYHLKESGFPYADSTGQHPGTRGVAPTRTAGVVGHGESFGNGHNYITPGPVKLSQQFTASAWIDVTPNAFSDQVIWASKQSPLGADGFAWYINDWQSSDHVDGLQSGNTGGAFTQNSTGTISFGQWHYMVNSYDDTAATVSTYVDGLLTGSAATVPGFGRNNQLNLGAFTDAAYFFNGVMDEARIQSGVCSLDWIWATWLSVASNNVFNSFSAVNPSPSLCYTNSSAGAFLTWPEDSGVFAVYTTTNLAPPAVWLPVTNGATYINGQWQSPVLLPASGAQFYRLQAR